MRHVKDDRTTAAAAIIADDAGGDGTAPPERAFLVVYHGQGDGSRGYVVPLPDGVTVTVGRLEDNHVAVDHERVSRRHARVIRYRADILVEDLDSRNGTRINGVAISGPTRVSSGDEITIGPASIIVGVTTGMLQERPVGSASEFEDRLAAELDRATRYHRPLGLLMIRLEGSAAAVSRAIDGVAGALRRMDYLAQYGPEEYAVIVPEIDRQAAEGIASDLAREANRAGAGHSGGIGIHIGLAVCPENGTRSGELLSRARTALRVARSGGDSGIAGAPDEPAPPPGNIVVVDPMMKRVFAMCRKVADTPITVLVLGETGTGKEIVANALHQMSSRASQSFQALNCSALPATLLESELFGHERGAFTGADRRKIGYFEAARGGTLFLDEIGEMPLEVQAKLLRVLEDRSITRVGGTARVTIDVRVVCATNRDLEAGVQTGRFREDLYFRISAFNLVVPPLRDRRSEIVPLASHFARQFSLELGQPPPSFTRAGSEALERYDWPGNVRELRNAIERAVVLQPGVIDIGHLPDRVAAALSGSTRGPTTDRTSHAGQPSGTAAPSPGGKRSGDIRTRVADVERQAVVEALDRCDGNQTHAARELGISRWALIRLMQKYGLKKRPRAPR